MSNKQTAAPAATTEAVKVKKTKAPSLLSTTNKKLQEMRLKQIKDLRTTQKEELKMLRTKFKAQREELKQTQSTQIKKIVDDLFESLQGNEMLATSKQKTILTTGKNKTK